MCKGMCLLIHSFKTKLTLKKPVKPFKTSSLTGFSSEVCVTNLTNHAKKTHHNDNIKQDRDGSSK